MKRWMSRLFAALVVTGLVAAPPISARAQSTDELKKDIETLKEGMRAIQKDLQEIKALLQRPAAAPPQNVVLDLGSSPFKGERTAKLTMIEFSDYQ